MDNDRERERQDIIKEVRSLKATYDCQDQEFEDFQKDVDEKHSSLSKDFEALAKEFLKCKNSKRRDEIQIRMNEILGELRELRDSAETFVAEQDQKIEDICQRMNRIAVRFITQDDEE